MYKLMLKHGEPNKVLSEFSPETCQRAFSIASIKFSRILNNVPFLCTGLAWHEFGLENGEN